MGNYNSFDIGTVNPLLIILFSYHLLPKNCKSLDVCSNYDSDLDAALGLDLNSDNILETMPATCDHHIFIPIIQQVRFYEVIGCLRKKKTFLSLVEPRGSIDLDLH